MEVGHTDEREREGRPGARGTADRESENFLVQ